MTLVFIGAILLPLTLTLVAGMRIGADRAERNLIDANARALDGVRDSLDELRDRIEDMAGLLANSESVKEGLRQGKGFGFAQAGHEIWEMVQVEAYDAHSNLLAVARIKGLKKGMYASPKDAAFVSRILALESATRFYRTKNGLVMKTGKPVLDYATLEIIGAVVVTLPVNEDLVTLLKERVGAAVGVFWEGEDGETASAVNHSGIWTGIPWARLLDQARSGFTGVTAGGEQAERRYITAYAPLTDQPGEPVGVLATAMDYQGILAGERDAMRLLGISAASALILAILLGVVIAHRFTQPIHRMLGVIRRMTDGDFSERLPLTRADEFGDLAEAFNDMAGRLAEERRSLARSEKRYRALFENATEGVFRSTISGKLIEVNPALARLMGYAGPEELVASVNDIGAQLFVDPDERGRYLDRLRREGVIHNQELLLKRLDGREIWASESSRIISDPGGEDGIIEGFVVDVTERKKAEALERTAIEAQAANKAKSEFLASMSHEIRTPLNVIAGLSEAALAESREDKRRECLETCHDAASHLLDLVNGILDFSRVEAGKLELESSDFVLDEALSRVMRTMRPQAAGKGLRLELVLDPDAPQCLRGDAPRLRQILINLIGNAVKFTEKGGVILTVSRRPGTREDGRVDLAFAVRDTGPGIDPDKLQAVFGQYAQENAAIPRRFGGSGLGLSISRKLAELMGGELQVESGKGRGSVFTFEAPFTPGDPEALRAEAAPLKTAQDAKPLRVLVVEDNSANVKVALSHLERLGHTAAVAGDGAQAIAALRETPFDVVLMDLEMPVMNGFEAVRAIRSGGAGVLDPDLPIVIMTAHALAQTKARCLASGMDGYLTKPVNPRRLGEALVQAVFSPREADEGVILDERLARRELGVEPQDFPAIMDAALGEIGKRSPLLERALAEGDFKGARLQAHSVKGSAAAIGAVRLRHAALRLEQAAQNCDMVMTQRLAESFFSEIDALMQCARAA